MNSNIKDSDIPLLPCLIQFLATIWSSLRGNTSTPNRPGEALNGEAIVTVNAIAAASYLPSASSALTKHRAQRSCTECSTAMAIVCQMLQYHRLRLRGLSKPCDKAREELIDLSSQYLKAGSIVSSVSYTRSKHILQAIILRRRTLDLVVNGIVHSSSVP